MYIIRVSAPIQPAHRRKNKTHSVAIIIHKQRDDASHTTQHTHGDKGGMTRNPIGVWARMPLHVDRSTSSSTDFRKIGRIDDGTTQWFNHWVAFGLRYSVVNLRSSVFGLRSFCLRHSVLGIRSSVFGLRSSVLCLFVFGLRSSVFGRQSSVFGLRSSVFGLFVFGLRS